MQFPGKDQLLYWLLLLMLAGSLLSAVVLSCSIIAFIIIACINRSFARQLTAISKTPLTAGISLLFFIPFVSGLWTGDLQNWLQIMMIKLPFLFLPLAFCTNWRVTEKQWQRFASYVLIILLLATLWSIVMYLINSENINEAYLKAKTLPVPMRGDHVRFSWLICFGILLSFLLFERTIIPVRKNILLFMAGWFFVYLHLLAARTGLVAAYLLITCFLVKTFLQQKPKGIALALLTGTIFIILFCWISFPTLQNRIRFLTYTFSFTKTNHYLPGNNDGNRILSLQGGWQILQDHALGVGAGSIRENMSLWYDAHVPGILEEDKIFPANEWLIHGDMAGWPGLLLFTMAVCMPFFEKRINNRFYWVMLLSIGLFVNMIDSGLEGQYGIFIYSFTTLWFWKWLTGKNDNFEI